MYSRKDRSREKRLENDFLVYVINGFVFFQLSRQPFSFPLCRFFFFCFISRSTKIDVFFFFFSHIFFLNQWERINAIRVRCHSNDRFRSKRCAPMHFVNPQCKAFVRSFELERTNYGEISFSFLNGEKNEKRCGWIKYRH